MLMNLEQEVGDISVTVGHAFETFYLVIDAFRDGSSYLAANGTKKVKMFCTLRVIFMKYQLFILAEEDKNIYD